MSTWLIPRSELTPEQLRAIELDTRENRVVLGGPGSGKTQILLHRAAYLTEKLKVTPKEYHIFVYTKVLRDYIQSAFDLLNLDKGSVSTLDSWCMGYYRDNISGKTPWNKDDKCPDFAAIRKGALAKLQTLSKKPYRFVLVDEAQDLDSESLKILSAMADHITVCADQKQQLYQHGSDISVILKSLAVRRSNVSLLETFRCSPYIVKLASQLIDDPAERNAYIQQIRTSQSEREKLLLYRAADHKDESSRLIDLVRTRLTKGERIAILFPQVRQAYGYANGFQEAGIDVESPNDLDFTSDKPKLMPYHSAKGLTFDSVFLPRLLNRSFGKVGINHRINLLFVGMTRATKWIYFSTILGDTSFEPLERLVLSNSKDNLTIQNSSASTAEHNLGKPDIQFDDIGDLL
jgi:superfamily I DNA/RNA helicase